MKWIRSVGGRDVCNETCTQVWVEQISLQILVVVAINHMKSVMTDEDKGSERTLIELGLVGPKKSIDIFREKKFFGIWKGKWTNFHYFIERVVVTQPNLNDQRSVREAFSLLFNEKNSFESNCSEKRINFHNSIVHVYDIRTCSTDLWKFKGDLFAL